MVLILSRSGDLWSPKEIRILRLRASPSAQNDTEDFKVSPVIARSEATKNPLSFFDIMIS